MERTRSLCLRLDSPYTRCYPPLPVFIETSVWIVLLGATITAVATGLGALSFLVVRNIGDWWLGVFTDT